MIKTFATSILFTLICAVAGFGQCAGNLTYSLNPSPTNDSYVPGQTVEICGSFTFTSYGTIWAHGIVPIVSEGWDLSSLEYTLPSGCSYVGSWGWYESVTGISYTSGTYGPGMFYDTGGDNNPGNNYGDNCGSGAALSFCITLTTSTDPTLNGAPLNVDFMILGDNHSGAWGNVLCPPAIISGPDIFLNDCVSEDHSFEVCANASSFSLFELFNSAPSGGSWTNPLGNITSGIFNPGTSAQGIYTYTIDTGVCSVSSTVTVSVDTPGNAGTGQNIEVCQADTPFQLFEYIIGGYSGGSWTDPDGNPFEGTFTPGESTAGQYTYSVGSGTGCPQSETVVSVVVNPLPHAGNNGSLAVCADGAQMNLFNFLMNAPTAGGSWSDPEGNLHNGWLSPATAISGDYTYTIGESLCSSSAVVSVTIVQLPYAGENTSVAVCENIPIDLFTLLPGADNNGFWANPLGQGFDGIFDPAIHAAGDYIYQVGGMSCNDIAVVSLSVATAPSGTISANSSYCQYGDATVAFELTGTAPFDVIYTVNGTAFTITNIASEHTEDVSGTGDLEVKLLQITDNSELGCTGSGNTITVDMVPTPSAHLSGGGSMCVGTGAALHFSLTGQGPFDVTFTDGTQQIALSEIEDGHTETVYPTEDVTYTLVNVTDNSTSLCSGNVSGNAGFSVSVPPSGSISGGGEICLGEATTLTFNLSGTAPFNVVYTDGADFFNLYGINDGHILTVSPAYFSFYELVSVVSQGNPNCLGSSNGLVTVSVSVPPVYNNLSVLCNDINEAYQVSFIVEGGDATSYSVTGMSGTLSGNVFISDEIPSGTTYHFFIDDFNNCGPVEVSGNHTCDCITSAGTIQNTVLEVCSSEMAVATHLGNHLLDANDALIYILHDAAGNDVGEIFAESQSPQFQYGPALDYNTTYYISAVAGNASGNSVDFSDPCLSVSPGVAVTFLPAPEANFLGEIIALCPGSSTDLMLSLTGTVPIQITYSIDGEASDSFIADDLSTSIHASIAATYTITSLSDVHCSSSPNESIEVFALETPHATISDAQLCEGLGGGPEINLTGNEPWTMTYTINGSEAAPIEIDSSPYILEATSSGTYEITAIADAYCTGTAGGQANVSISPVPTASISGGGQICEGSFATVVFESESAETLTYAIDGQIAETIALTNSITMIETDISGTYTIVEVSDQNCTAFGDGNEVQVVVNPIPNASISLSQNTVCAGDSLLLSIEPTGSGPFEVVYMMDGELMITETNAVIHHYVHPQQNTEYTLISISDGTEPACVRDLNEGVIAQVLLAPEAPVLNDVSRCNQDPAIEIGVTPEPNLSYAWWPQTGLSNPAIANPVLSIQNETPAAQSDEYTLTVSNGICSTTAAMNVTLYADPQVDFSHNPDQVTTEATAVNFYNHTPGNNDYTWLVFNSVASNSTHMIYTFPEGVEQNYEVTLLAEDQNTGCEASLTEVIAVVGELTIFVPNAFSPDGDGINELFGPVIHNYRPEKFEFLIYNRQGELVFQTSSPDLKWDGSDASQTHYAQDGVYVWVLKTSDRFSSSVKELTGSVTVLR